MEFCDIVIAAAKKHKDQFLAAGVEIKPACIFPSEMLAFCALCLEQGVNVILESGRKHGYSTEVSRAVVGCEVVSVEQSFHDAETRLRRLGIECIRGNGNELIPKFVDQYAGRRIAVMLDGPKGITANGLIRRIIDKVVFAAVHDLSQNYSAPDGTLPNPARPEFRKMGQTFLTDCEEYRTFIGDMDKAGLALGGYESYGQLGTCCYTLGMIQGGQFQLVDPGPQVT